MVINTEIQGTEKKPLPNSPKQNIYIIPLLPRQGIILEEGAEILQEPKTVSVSQETVSSGYSREVVHMNS